MKIVVAGAGEVGTHLAKMLCNEDHDITVIDSIEENLRNIASSLDLLTLHGSATSISILEEANIKKADLFISVMPTEEVNIVASILAKKLGVAKTIARIDNQEYLMPGNIDYFLGMGIDYMIFPESIAAKEIIDLLHQTATTEIVEFSGGKLLLYVMKLDETAPVIGKTLREVIVDPDHLEYRAIAITRNGQTIIPRGSDRFMLHDVLYAISSPKGINDLMRMSGKEQYEAKNIMIIGGGRTAVRTAEGLGFHHNIKLIEINREKSYRLSNLLKNTLVINGDGRDMDLLAEEKLEKMDACVALTGSSETNILACLHAKSLGVKKTIAEVENFNYINLAVNLGVDTIINKKLSAASRIFRFTTTSGQVASVKCLRGTDAEVLEFVAKPGSKITKDKLKNIGFPKDAIVGGVVRDKESIIAIGSTKIKAGDRVVIFALPSAFKEVGKYFS